MKLALTRFVIIIDDDVCFLDFGDLVLQRQRNLDTHLLRRHLETHFHILVFRWSVRQSAVSVPVTLTESRYRMIFPGCVSTLFMTSSTWMLSGTMMNPDIRPTSMMTMPVAFRPRSPDRLQNTTRQCEDGKLLIYRDTKHLFFSDGEVIFVIRGTEKQTLCDHFF